MSHREIYAFWYLCCQLESTVNLFSRHWKNWSYPKVVSPGRSKLIDSALDKKLEDQVHFSPKTRLWKKEKGFDIAYYVLYHKNWWIEYYRVTGS